METFDPNSAGGILRISPEQGQWIVLKTRPRCEKKVQQHCQEQEATVYLPLQKRTHRYGGRTRDFLTPLFPTYIFCAARPEQRTDLLNGRHVVRGLDVVDQAGLVRQLQTIERALQEEKMIEVMPFLKRGRTVIVRAGPMKGVEGIIERIKGRTRVVINVNMIQQAVAVEVDSADLSPA